MVKRFFGKINYPFIETFKDVTVDKVVVKKEKKIWDVYLKNNTPISPQDSFNLINKAKEGIEDVKLINVFFEFKEITDQNLKEYVKFYLDMLIEKNPCLISLVGNEIKIEDNIVYLDVLSKIEKDILKDNKKYILKYLKHFNFNIDKIKIKINEEKRNLLQEEMDNEKKPTIKKRENTPIIGAFSTVEPTSISDIYGEEANVVFEAKLFKISSFVSKKTKFCILTLSIYDGTDSMFAKYFTKNEEEFNLILSNLKEGQWYKISGYTKLDDYAKDIVLNIKNLEKIESKDPCIYDISGDKRIELHAHTKMSLMDSVVNGVDLVKEAIKWNHKAIAITDHNNVQAFPEIDLFLKGHNKGKDEEDKFKVIYGAELEMVDDYINISIRGKDINVMDETYVVFDVETTGLNAGAGDSLIEIGAVKFKSGEVIDEFSHLIDPKVKLKPIITQITGIKDEDLKGQESEETILKLFKEFIEDHTLVAHNAKFDISFLEVGYKKYDLGIFTNPVVDTLELSRALEPNQFRHSLSALVKRYSIEFDENKHHRALYDAEATALILQKMLRKISDYKLNKLHKLVKKEEIHKFGRVYHVNILAKNQTGLKNLFKLISYASTKYFHKTPKILRSVIEEYREGLLIGSGCYKSEIFTEASYKTEEELINVIDFYDYVEVQPPKLYDHLIQSGVLTNYLELENLLKKIINTTKLSGKLIVATGDVHHLTKEDKIFREIVVNQNVPGGGRHPLNRKNIDDIPSAHLRTTDEMYKDFEFIKDEKLKKELIIDNPNKINEMVDYIDVIHNTNGVPFSPKIDNSEQLVKDMVYKNAREIYGDNLPIEVEDRIKEELKGILKGGYDVIYYISHKLVKKSNEDGYIVGSRGSVGSSFVATMMNITEVNPLPAHYICKTCKKAYFKDEEGLLSLRYDSGYDLPDKKCDKCNNLMGKEGQDMPFATFLGFNADKVPDIDLNFSGEYQAKAHDYTKELFGEDYVFRAGTIGTVANKTAYGFVLGFMEEKGITFRKAEIERLASGCTGVKRTSGQHPGGLVVVPNYMDIFDFTPYQYPADDQSSKWKTTHFDYNPMEDEILKLDILGHDDPTMLKMLEDLSGIDVTKVPITDSKVLSLLSSPDALGVSKKDIMCETGTLGVPELGTKFVISMLNDTKPKTFSEAVKISGLSHGTDVWLGNARDLIKEDVVKFNEVIGCRDDIMVYLINEGVEPLTSFKIMEFVRKGKPARDPSMWSEYVKTLKAHNIPSWYIDSLGKIKYMFPKAHAVAYIMSALRVAYFKVYYPIYYYSAYFSVRCDSFEVDTLLSGDVDVRKRIMELENKGYDISKKEVDLLDVLYSVLEMLKRGYSFSNIDIEKSDSTDFIITEDKKSLLIPFRALDGLGDKAAENVVKERKNRKFISIEDFQLRGKVTSTTVDKMRGLKVFKDLPESSQLSLF